MEKKIKRHSRAKFAVFGLLFLLLLMLPSVHAQSSTASPFNGVSSLVGAFGSPYLFAFAVFIMMAFFTGYIHLPWAPSLLIYMMTFTLFSVLGLFSFDIVVLMMLFVGGTSAYGMTKIIADLIFA
jgi:hypothetical protein